MKYLQFTLVCFAVFLTFTVLHTNIINDAQSSVAVIENTYIETLPVISVANKVLLPEEIVESSHEFTPVNDSNDAVIAVLDTSVSGQLYHGDTFDSALRRDNVPDEIRSLIIKSLTKTLDFKRLKPQDTYHITYDDSGHLDSFRYSSGPLDSISITNSHDGYKVQKDPIELERQRILISGTIRSSLFASFNAKNEDVRLVYAFADIFASKIDFNTEVQQGDQYSILVDKYFKNGKLVGYGNILSAGYYFASGISFKAYYYTPTGESYGSYFDPTGSAVGASFIKSPLPFGRVSSRFSYRRKHPVTGVVKPHLGIDLAAPKGTPIMAAADGTVISIGRNGGNGKQIILKHLGGYKTYYGHLSGFKGGLHKGDVVRKKDIIGYVGSTGIATGPHLDYRVQHNNTFKNPFSIEFKPKSVLNQDQLTEFYALKEKLTTLAGEQITSNETTIIQSSNLTLSSSRQLTLL